jgi:type I restriction enzyme S subunit
MHKLFTEGTRGEEQKETEIGLMPKSWEVINLGQAADLIMGQSPPSSSYNTKGIGLPFLQGKAEFGGIYPRPKKWCSKPIKIAQKNDVLISVRAPVGDVNIAPFDCCIGRGLAAIRPKDCLEQLYLFYYLLTVKQRLESEGRGTTFKAIGRSVLENFKLPLPPLPEQHEIAHALSSLDKKIETEEKRKATLQQLFKTMLNKLMTGEIRVKDLDLGVTNVS